MRYFTLAGCFSKLKLAVILSLLTIIIFSCSNTEDETRMSERKSAMVFMGGEAFDIPKAYLSPSDEFPDKIEEDYLISISFFFPDFSGYGARDNIRGVGPYNPNQVTAFWTVINSGGHLDANNRLKNALKYRSLKRDGSLDFDGLTAYKDINLSGVTYHAQNSQGDDVIIQCSGLVNNICRLRYFDSKSNRGIFASFDTT